MIERLAATSGLSTQVGGGIRTDRDVARLLEAGVDRLIIGTMALDAPIPSAGGSAGSASAPLTITLDLRGDRLQGEGWLKESTVGVAELIARVESWEVPEVICTAIERDGTQASRTSRRVPG